MKNVNEKVLKMVIFFLCVISFSTSYAIAWDYEYNLIEPAGSYNINLRGANSNGTAVGFMSSSGGAFSYSSTTGEVTVLDASAYAMDINNSSQWVGFKMVDINGTVVERGILHSNGSDYTITYNDGSDRRTIVNGINENGNFVGVYISSGVFPDIVADGFYYDGSTFSNIHYPNSLQTFAWDINDSGLIVGYYEDSSGVWHGFTCDTTTTQYTYSTSDMIIDGITYPTFITGINNAGERSGYFCMPGYAKPVLGYKEEGGGSYRDSDSVGGFVYRDSTYIPIDYFMMRVVERVGSAYGKIVGDTSMMGCSSSVCPEESCRTGVILTLTNSTTTQPSVPGASDAVGNTVTVNEITFDNVGHPSFFFNFFAVNLNDSGQVVGSAPDPDDTGNTNGKPFLWSADQGYIWRYTDAVFGYATSINNAGNVSGVAQMSGQSSFVGKPFFRSAPTGQVTNESYIADCSNLFIVSFYVLGSFINNNNEIVYSRPVKPTMYYENGRFEHTARSVSQYKVAATDMNDYGQVTGFLPLGNPGCGNGMIWSKDSWPPTYLLQAASESSGYSDVYIPAAINNSGIVVGTRCTVDPTLATPEVNTSQGFVIEPGGTTPILLPLLSGYTNTAATDINEAGEIVGYAYQSGAIFPGARIVIWPRLGSGSYGTPVDLNSLVGSSYTLTVLTSFDFNLVQESYGDAMHGILNANMLLTGLGPKLNDNHQVLTMANNSSGTPMGVLLTLSTTTTPTTCVEDASGALDVIGTPACTSTENTLDVPIQIQFEHGVLDAFGFEITFDPDVLQFDSVVAGDGLVAGFYDFDYGQPTDENNATIPGVVRFGAYSINNKIGQDVDGVLLYVRFRPLSQEVTMVDVRNLDDDMAGWTTSPGCIAPFNGDITLDSEVSPDDALCALEKASYVCPTGCGPCATTLCDVNGDCDCTADDAECMLDWYLGIQSCLGIQRFSY